MYFSGGSMSFWMFPWQHKFFTFDSMLHIFPINIHCPCIVWQPNSQESCGKLLVWNDRNIWPKASKNKKSLDIVTQDVVEIANGQLKVNTGVKFKTYSNVSNCLKLLLRKQQVNSVIVRIFCSLINNKIRSW